MSCDQVNMCVCVFVSNYSLEVNTDHRYLLLCAVARKREDMLSLGTRLCSAAHTTEIMRGGKWKRQRGNVSKLERFQQ